MTKQLLLVLLTLLLIYGVIEAWPLIRGPALVIDSPLDNTTVASSTVIISGSAEHVSTLTLNGAPLLYGQTGHFSKAVAFPSGSSILTFTAADRFGRTTTATRTIYVP